MKKILNFIFVLLFTGGIIYSAPNNLPTPGTLSPKLNTDGSLSIHGDNTMPSQIQMKSLSSNNNLYLTAPDNATAGYRITFMNSPTNGVFVGTVSNATNVVLSSISGVTQNIDVLVAGNTTNRLVIVNGIITSITAL